MDRDELADDHGQIPPVAGTKPDVPEACCKVARVTGAYQLGGIDYELRRRYENDDATLHELADYINDRVTAVTLDAINNPPETEPSTVRAALQGEETIPATRRDDLRATLAGQLDIELLTGTYVSHETVRRHLNEHLDVSTSRGGFETVDEFENALEAYQEQYESGVESSLERAAMKGLIDGGEFRVFSTRIQCKHCSDTYRVRELLDAGGCDCQR